MEKRFQGLDRGVFEEGLECGWIVRRRAEEAAEKCGRFGYVGVDFAGAGDEGWEEDVDAVDVSRLWQC